MTPEIRDLLAKYNIKTVCLDKNPLMIEAMARLIKKKNPREKVIRGSWFAIPFPKETFDLVVSDCPHDNLPYGDLARFFAEVARVIKKGGYFMVGTHCFVGRVKPITFAQFLARYKKSPKDFRNPSRKFYHYMCLSGDPMIYHKKNHTGDWIKLAQELDRLRKKGVLTKKEHAEISFPVTEVSMSLAMKFTTLSRKEFWEFMKKSHLSILGFLEDDEFPAGMFRQAYILKKMSDV